MAVLLMLSQSAQLVTGVLLGHTVLQGVCKQMLHVHAASGLSQRCLMAVQLDLPLCTLLES